MKRPYKQWEESAILTAARVHFVGRRAIYMGCGQERLQIPDNANYIRLPAHELSTNVVSFSRMTAKLYALMKTSNGISG